MSIRISNDWLENRIAREAERRNYKSLARTLEDLAAERLAQIEAERKAEPATSSK